MSPPKAPDETSSRRSCSPATKGCIFYKLIVPSIVQDKKLRIPGKFVRQFQDELSAVATLTLPNGDVWLVELKKEESKLWFYKGWHEFIEHLSIRVGYFLVFRYEGNSNFTVYVYDLTACEIKIPCNTTSSSEGPNHPKHCSVLHAEGIETSVSCDMLGSCHPCPTPSFLREEVFDECIDLQKFSNNYSWTEFEKSTYEVCVENQQLTKDADNLQATGRSTRDKGTQFEGIGLTEIADQVGKGFSNEATRTRRRRKQRTEPDELELSADHNVKLGNSSINIPLNKITRRWRDVTTEEKERAVSAADMFKPVNPFFKVILRPSYVYRGFLLHIPASFARKHLRGVSAYITLKVSEGKQWPVLLIYSNNGAKLTKGWPEFAWENYLEEGDVCVFEMIRTNDIVLIVTIFRVLEDAKPVDQIPNEMSAISNGFTNGHSVCQLSFEDAKS